MGEMGLYSAKKSFNVAKIEDRESEIGAEGEIWVT